VVSGGEQCVAQQSLLARLVQIYRWVFTDLNAVAEAMLIFT
jgi:hypothetical protein